MLNGTLPGNKRARPRFTCGPAPARYEMQVNGGDDQDHHHALAEHYAAFWNDLERTGLEPTDSGIWKVADELAGGSWVLYHDGKDGFWKVIHADEAPKVVRHARAAQPIRYAQPRVFVYRCPYCQGLAFQNDPIQGGLFIGYALCSRCGRGFSILGKNPIQRGPTSYAAKIAILRYAAKRIPKGYIVNKDGRVFRAGMWVSEQDLATATPAPTAGTGAAAGTPAQGPVAEAARQAAYHHEKRRARGPVDRDKLGEKLEPHANQMLAPHEATRAKRTFAGLHQHHGELTAHRVEELINGAHEALAHVHPDDEITRERLSKRLHSYEHMLNWHDAKMKARSPWEGGEPQKGKVYQVPTAAIGVDPARFQFKLNTNKTSGVTDELKGVKKFDKELAGTILVWRDPADGRTWVINGHHRRELAERTGEETMNVMYLDTKDPLVARARGALANIAEGRGTAVDAAKFMRDTGKTPAEMENDGISLKGKVAGDAVILTHLNDRLFNKVAMGLMPVDEALTIAAHVHDPYLQDLLVNRLDKEKDKGRDISPRLLGEMARKCAEAPKIKSGERGGQPDMFGDLEDEDSTFVEMCDLQAFVRAELAKDVNDWKAVSSKRRIGKVTGGDTGNELNLEANKENAKEAAIDRGTFDRLVNRSGLIADTFKKYAVEFARAQTQGEKNDVRKRCLNDVRTAIGQETAAGPGPSLSPDAGAMAGGGPGPQGGHEGDPAAQPDAAAAPDAGRGDAGAHGIAEAKKENDLSPGRMPVSYAQSPTEKASRVPDWKDPPHEVSPWLSDSDKKIEQETQTRARQQYPELKKTYVAKNGTLNPDGSLKSIQLNTDEWRTLFPEYHGTNAAAVHEASSYLNKRLLNDAMHEMRGKGNNTFAILAGGGGSGKGTAVGQFFNVSDYPIVVDQVSDKISKVDKLLDAAKAAGYASSVVFVDRNPKDAWLGGVVPRAVNARKRSQPARTVPLEVALKANLHARQATIEMLKSGKHPVSVIDNNHGVGEAIFHQDPKAALAYLESQQHDEAKLKEELEHETFRLHESGEIPGDIAEGLIGKESIAHRRLQPGQPQGSYRERDPALAEPAKPPAGTPDQGAVHGSTDGGSQQAPRQVIRPANSLGIPRSEMPQIASKYHQEFMDGLRQSGVKVEEGQARVGDLKPTQNELSVEGMDELRDLAPEKLHSHVIVSSDGYILDGHHRWGALNREDPNNTIKTRTVDLPIRELLQKAKEFPHTFYKSIQNKIVAPANGSYHEQIVNQRQAEVPRGVKGTLLNHLATAGANGMTADELKSAMGEHGQHAEEAVKQLDAAGKLERVGDRIKIKGAVAPGAVARPVSTRKRPEAAPPAQESEWPPREEHPSYAAQVAAQRQQAEPVAPKPEVAAPKATPAQGMTDAAKKAIKDDPGYQAAVKGYADAPADQKDAARGKMREAQDAALAAFRKNPQAAPTQQTAAPSYHEQTKAKRAATQKARPGETTLHAIDTSTGTPKLVTARAREMAGQGRYEFLDKNPHPAFGQVAGMDSHTTPQAAWTKHIDELGKKAAYHQGQVDKWANNKRVPDAAERTEFHTRERDRAMDQAKLAKAEAAKAPADAPPVATTPKEPTAPKAASPTASPASWAGQPELQKKVYGEVTVKPDKATPYAKQIAAKRAAQQAADRELERASMAQSPASPSYAKQVAEQIAAKPPAAPAVAAAPAPLDPKEAQLHGFLPNLFPFKHNGQVIPEGKGWVQHGGGGQGWATFTNDQASKIVAQAKAAGRVPAKPEPIPGMYQQALAEQAAERAKEKSTKAVPRPMPMPAAASNTAVPAHKPTPGWLKAKRRAYRG